jgi:hypothetical protein
MSFSVLYGDLAGDAVFQRPHVRRRRAGRFFLDCAAGGDERERDAVDLGVLGVETFELRRPLRRVDAGQRRGVAHAAQPAADDLLAEQLRAERADAEDVRDGVGVPPLGEHGDRDDALDLLAELAGLADGVHHLAEQVLVGDLLDIPAGEALAQVVLELVNLAAGDPAELLAHRLAAVELLGIDQDRVRAIEETAAGDVAEEVEPARYGHG